MILERTECSPVQLLSDVAALMRVRADAKGLQLHVRLGVRQPATILLRSPSPLRLRPILIMLCGNAIKFTDSAA
ncbi:MAG: hypothetical protein ABIP94_24660 [Planctomycetota bacterium]